MSYRGLLLCLALVVFEAPAHRAFADDPLTSPRTQWFRSARFGMFIHWGLYSAAAGEWDGKPIDGLGEWILDRARIPEAEYQRLVAGFNPAKFDAAAWVALAKDAGMKYLVVTGKHHDGFCMWGTKLTPYNIVDATPFRRDPLKELSAACKSAGIRFGIYYSIMDWHRPELAGYWNAGASAATDPLDPRVLRYIDGQLKPQIGELIAGYDPDLLWFDGEWRTWWTQQYIVDGKPTTHGENLEAFCRSLKPRIVINARVAERHSRHGDYDTPEQAIPDSIPDHRLWEVCMTLNDTWGYKKSDRHFKHSDEVISRLQIISAKGGNFLLNLGPDGTGVIPPESAAILHETGSWLRAHPDLLQRSQAITQKGAP